MIIENETQYQAMRALQTALTASRSDILIIKGLPEGTTVWLNGVFSSMIAGVEARCEVWRTENNNKP